MPEQNEENNIIVIQWFLVVEEVHEKIETAPLFLYNIFSQNKFASEYLFCSPH